MLATFPTKVCERFLGVCSIPLWPVLVGEVIVMIVLLCLLEVHVVNIQLINELDTWAKVKLDTVEQDEACQNQSTVC